MYHSAFFMFLTIDKSRIGSSHKIENIFQHTNYSLASNFKQNIIKIFKIIAVYKVFDARFSCLLAKFSVFLQANKMKFISS